MVTDATSVSPAIPADHRRLMVVDAVETSRSALAEHFRARGWEVAVAADGIDAVAQALTRPVDVVLLSTTLPDLDGYETAAILTRVTPRVRVVLTVDAESPAASRRRRSTSLVRCFLKPLDLDSLARAIEENRPEAGLASRPGTEDRR
jgi:CheY-like chemotaxis protein